MVELYFTGEQSDIANHSFFQDSSLIVPYPCQYSCNCSPYLVKFFRGRYTISLYGAAGGNADSRNGGKGGMVKVNAMFRAKESLYLFVGGIGIDKGKTLTCGNKGYNGGGVPRYNRGGGGGATDLRKIEGDLSSRILVAAGTGGAYYESSAKNSDGGDGGGEEGTPGGTLNSNNIPCIGSQNGCINGKGVVENGTLGYGASAENGKILGSGGGGYYGGGAAEWTGSSGGSSYLGTFHNGITRSGVNIGNGYAVIRFTGNSCSVRRAFNTAFLYYVLLVGS